MKKLTAKILGTTLLVASLQANAASEVHEDNNSYYHDAPPAEHMLLDAVIAKPIHAAMVAGGFIAFVASIPFSTTADSYNESWERLVVEPAVDMRRCLGCTPAQDESKLQYEYKQQQAGANQ